MPKVKIATEDLATFSAAAAAAGTTVDRWLTEAGREYALAAAATSGQPGARIVHVPVSAGTAALLDEETDRSGAPDWAYAARLLQDVLAAPDVDPERLWADVIMSISLLVGSERQLTCLEQMWIDTIVGDTVLLVAADAYTRDIVEVRMRPAIAEALSRHLGHRVQIAVTIDQTPAPVIRRAPARPRPARHEDLPSLLAMARTLAGSTGGHSRAG